MLVLQPLSAQAQQAKKIDISSAVAFLGCFDYKQKLVW
jgi:hypothetical protein